MSRFFMVHCVHSEHTSDCAVILR